MPTIQETISKAIMAKGTIILKNRAALCIAIEDLSPDLSEELKFIKKVYNDEIGGILYEALIEGNIVKKRDLLNEADRYLDEENGRNSVWREKILSYFRDIVMNAQVSKITQNSTNNILTGIGRSIENAGSRIKTGDTMQEGPGGQIRKNEALNEMDLGEKCEKNGEYEKAFNHYLRAAILGDAKGAFYVGYMYEYGEGVKKDLNSAVKWYLAAANAGNRGAQHNLGYFYYTGTAVKQDFKMAFSYFSMAAKQGKPDSMLNIGVMYENGQYVKQDFKEALRWYNKADDAGDENGAKFYQALSKRIT